MDGQVSLAHRLVEHLRRHPYRLLATGFAAFALTWGGAVWAIVDSFDNAHKARVAVCRSVNELRRDIVIAASDLGADPLVVGRLVPTEDCESLP